MNGEKKRARLDQRRAPIHEALENFRQMRVVPFDVPGHKRGRGNPELTAFLGQQCVGVDVNSMKPLDNVPMSVHRSAKDILVIGAGDGGVVRELTRYDRVERIDLVEMDPQVIEACRAYLPGNACRMDDRRVHIYYENALKFIRKCENEYDLIIVDSSDPFGPSEGLFTREFYGNCYNALRDDGIMVNQQGSPFYAEDATAMQRSHKRIASTFPISKVYQAHIPTFAAGYWLFGFASKKYHPINDMDGDAWNALNMRTRYYTTRLHVGAFYLPAFLEEMLREVEDC